MENFHYYKHFKTKDGGVANRSVAHKTLRSRCSGDLLKRFNEHKYYSKQTESDFLRTLITEALDKRESESWQKEVAEW